jgi:hypothetical protein
MSLPETKDALYPAPQFANRERAQGLTIKELLVNFGELRQGEVQLAPSPHPDRAWCPRIRISSPSSILRQTSG